jgi:LysR family glycine cleavage system transcriptional activator
VTKQPLLSVPAPAERVPPFATLRAFESAARHLSFKKAAQELFVTPSAISQQIRLLEEHVGVPLFRRLTRALELTAEGEAMLPKVRDGLGALSAALALVKKPVITDSPLTVNAPPSFSTRWLLPRLQRFSRAHPEIDLRLTSSLEMIDGRSADNGHSLFIAPAEDTVAIRYGGGDYSGARVDRILKAAYVPVCSPSLLRGKHALREPGDLRHHTLIHDDTVPDESAGPSWKQWLARQGVEGIDAERGPHFTDGSLAIEAAADGMGVALALRPLVGSDVRAGRLAIPFDSAMPSSYAYYFVSPETANERPDLAQFRDWVLAEARSEA